MELRRIPAAIDSPAYLAQLKWDGVRCTARVSGGSVRLFSRSLRDRTARYPELLGLPEQVAADEAILDGELVVLRGGQPSFFAVMERELAQPGATAGRLALRQPAVYMVFDLVQLEGHDLTAQPLTDRQSALAAVWRPGGPAQLVESFPGTQGIALFRAVAERGLEGVVLKAASSPYVPGGVRTSHWLKVKTVRRLHAVVGGMAGPPGHPGSILLGLYDGERLRYIGRAGSGLGGAELEFLRRELTPGPCPFTPRPALGSLPVVWVVPQLVAAVNFAEWTPDLHLRHPVVAGFAGLPPESCIFA